MKGTYHILEIELIGFALVDELALLESGEEIVFFVIGLFSFQLLELVDGGFFDSDECGLDGLVSGLGRRVSTCLWLSWIFMIISLKA